MTAGPTRPAARPASAIERAHIHLAACRHRRQELACSECERSERLIRAVERSQRAEAGV